MRKWNYRGLLLSVLLLLFLPALSGGAGAAGKAVDIYLNGDLINIPPSFGAPFYDENHRLQIPMRYLIETCGYDVEWNNAQHTATIPTQKGNVVITLGSSTLTTPGGAVTMDTSATAKDSRTYIPMRYALEALGFQVAWTGGDAADTVQITGDIGAVSSRVPMTAAEVASLASPATFYIEVSDLNGTAFAGGSGFFIDPSGVGVTNYHVIEGAYHASITGVDGSTYTMGMVLYYDKDRDLAVFDAIPDDPNGKTTNVPYLNLAAPSSIHNGDVVYAIGSPLGLQNSITDGLVSNKDRTLPGDPLSYIQTSAPISSGNSGGPLLNQYGEVVGINAASLVDGQNLNLAVPAADLAKVDYSDSSQWLFLFQVADREAALPAPTNLRVVAQKDDTAYIQWDPVEGAEYYHLYYQEEGEDSYWYDGEDGGDEPMKFYYEQDWSATYSGLEKGVTYHLIVTAVANGVESADSQVLSFTFSKGAAAAGTSTSSSSWPSYPGAWWVPDFGALYGYTPVYSNVDANIGAYYYDVSSFSDISDYLDFLESVGLEYAPVSDRDDGSTDMVYYNDAIGKGVIVDVDKTTGNFVVFFTFN